MLEINRNPSARDLRWFGIVVALFLGLVGLVVWWRGGSLTVSGWMAGVGVGLAVLYYAVPPVRKHMFVGWMVLAFPIGWTMSMVILMLAYYAVLAPIGLLMRMLGHDPMSRKLEPDAATYWIERDTNVGPGRYFRQW